ncbi:MAG: hypothetical protein QM725_02920 [Lacibacter sp.]
MLSFFRNSLLCFFVFISCPGLYAQEVNFDSLQPVKSVNSEKDIVDIAKEILGFQSSNKTIIKPGDKPVFSALPAIGYTLQTRIAAIITGNAAFYTSKKAGTPLSVINASAYYTQNKQFTIPLQISVWNRKGTYNLIGDVRYMKYPQSTFGLGSNSSLKNENPLDYNCFRLYQSVLRKITGHFSAGIGYNLDHYWNVTEKGLTNGQQSDFSIYGSESNATSSGYSVHFIFDNRKNPINDKKGLLTAISYRNNVTWMGSNNNWQSLTSDIRKFIPLDRSSKNILALWLYSSVILDGKPPYLDLPSTGWDRFTNTGRGFIQGRFRGKNMLYAETEYRFSITKNGLLGAVLFANAESFSDASSLKLQKIQPAAGLGLRMKLNKKSDTNIAVDYGFGTQGMRGLFINIGEVF